MKRRYWPQAQGYDFQKVVARVAELSGLDAEQILMAGKQPQRVRARSLVCHWAVAELGMTAVAVGKLLGITQSAVTKALHRGQRLASRISKTNEP